MYIEKSPEIQENINLGWRSGEIMSDHYWQAGDIEEIIKPDGTVALKTDLEAGNMVVTHFAAKERRVLQQKIRTPIKNDYARWAFVQSVSAASSLRRPALPTPIYCTMLRPNCWIRTSSRLCIRQRPSPRLRRSRGARTWCRRHCLRRRRTCTPPCQRQTRLLFANSERTQDRLLEALRGA